MTWYNEHDPYAVEWLGNLMAAGLIPEGVIDARDIQSVRPDDVPLDGTCHWFAGIGGWARALDLAGWDPREPVWTASLPCQPFSCAGRRRGTSDERHLWPVFHRLVAECRPATIIGEQTGSPDGRRWLAAVRADLEALGYAVGAADLCAAGSGAPHIRQRLFWVAELGGLADRRFRVVPGRGGRGAVSGEAGDPEGEAHQRQRLRDSAGDGRPDGGLADRDGAGYQGHDRCEEPGEAESQGTRPVDPGARCHSGLVAESGGGGRRGPGRQGAEAWDNGDGDDAGRLEGPHGPVGGGDPGAELLGDPGDPGLQERFEPEVVGGVVRLKGSAFGPAEPLRGSWAGADWLYCRDEKWRPVEPGTFPLAHGLPSVMGPGKPRLPRLASRNRKGRLRGYGNAIVPETAATFIRAYLETREERNRE